MNRIGFGYDLHRFVTGRPLVLGGVRVEYNRGLVGHSDADAVLHAITDAVLGAIAAGDIGDIFPDTDQRWSGKDSSAFVLHAMELASAEGYHVANCDVTIIAQRPTLRDYKQLMRDNIATLLGVTSKEVSVKAKTNESVGALGRAEAIAANAVILLTGR